MTDFWNDDETRENRGNESNGDTDVTTEAGLDKWFEEQVEKEREIFTINDSEDSSVLTRELFVAKMSIVDQVETLLKTFPSERMSCNVIAETLGLTTKNVTGAILTSQRRGSPVFNDNGIYWYEPGGTPPLRSKQRNAEVITDKSELHDLSVKLYEIFDSVYVLTADGRKIVRGDIKTVLMGLSTARRSPFMFGNFISRTKIRDCTRYLTTLGSIKVAGPVKYLYEHPDKIDSSQISFPSIRNVPAPTAAAALDDVDPNVLAHALANGMWTRYEWVLTELGKTREQLAGLEEAIKVRDEEIGRLRANQAQPEILEIARELLSDI